MAYSDDRLGCICCAGVGGRTCRACQEVFGFDNCFAECMSGLFGAQYAQWSTREDERPIQPDAKLPNRAIVFGQQLPKSSCSLAMETCVRAQTIEYKQCHS